MPSAFKLEKQTSTDAPDTVKQILTVVEKKVRNLEKRKGKLDTYKNDHKNGKELNEDQKNAVKKYDLVVELLEFAKELQKSFNGVVHECIKLQKKAAKREQAERQQQEIQRIRELLLLQDILVNMGTVEIRNDFLLGNNGALLLDEDKLSQLDEFYKLVSPDRNSEDDDTPFEEQLLAAAEHLTSLLDGKNKEILNTTYKSLKELLIKINDCGYFSPSKSGTNNSTDDIKDIEQEFTDNPQESSELVMPGVSIEEEHTETIGLSTSTAHLDSPYYATVQYTGQNQPLQEVLPVQGNFNFLQESQIDLQSLHMDPAVVVAHPMIPSTTMGYPTQYHGSNLPSQNIQASQSEGGMVRPPAATSVVSSQVQVQGTNTANAPQLQQNPMNPPQDFDPSCPIPTQTFTNQNFSAVHPIVPVSVPGNYVPAAIAHPSLQQMVPVGIVPQHVSRTPSPPTSVSDSHTIAIAPEDPVLTTNVNLGSPSDNKEFDSEYQLQQSSIDNGGRSSHFGSAEYQQLEDSQGFSNSQAQNFAQNRGYTAARGNRGSRGRGSANGYTRSNSNTSGRGSYGNGRSGYQNSGNYYQGSYSGRDNFNNNSTNYSNAFKQRGSARGSTGAPRGSNPGTRGGNNGRGYRSQ